MENDVKTVCAKNQCVGCMACFDMCPKSAITIVDTRQAYNAVIDEENVFIAVFVQMSAKIIKRLH